MTINFLVAVLVWVILLVVVLVYTVPDVPVAPLMIASAVVLVALPLWFYPRSKTLWAAIEFLVARSDPDYAPRSDAIPAPTSWNDAAQVMPAVRRSARPRPPERGR